MTDSAPSAVVPIPLVLPPASFTNLAMVLKAVPLQYPVTFAGRDRQSIHIRRLSVEQIAAIMDNYRANLAIDPAAQMALPIFVDAAGEDVPDGLPHPQRGRRRHARGLLAVTDVIQTYKPAYGGSQRHVCG